MNTEIIVLNTEELYAWARIIMNVPSRMRIHRMNIEDESWEWLGEHLTVRMGPLNPAKEADKSLIPRRGKPLTMVVTEIGIDAERGVIAAGVSMAIDEMGNLPCLTTDGRKPHITLWVNRGRGGTPFLSNQITDWEEVGWYGIEGMLRAEVKDNAG